MSESTDKSPTAPSPNQAATHQDYEESAEELAYANRPFRGWRLLGVVGGVIIVLAIISGVVDWLVIGPLEGRVF